MKTYRKLFLVTAFTLGTLFSNSLLADGIPNILKDKKVGVQDRVTSEFSEKLLADGIPNILRDKSNSVRSQTTPDANASLLADGIPNILKDKKVGVYNHIPTDSYDDSNITTVVNV